MFQLIELNKKNGSVKTSFAGEFQEIFDYLVAMGYSNVKSNHNDIWIHNECDLIVALITDLPPGTFVTAGSGVTQDKMYSF